MITGIAVENFGPISHFETNAFGKINVFIGPNGKGKTYMLKAMYASLKSIEQFGRGKEQRSIKELLSDKLYWTYQSSRLGSLVKKGEKDLKLELKANGNQTLCYGFGNATVSQIVQAESSFEKRVSNSVFIPAKEVLSLRDIILESRSDNYNAFGFDDTYLDLANALKPTKKGRNVKSFSKARGQLRGAIHGKIEYDFSKKEWIFRDTEGNVFDISITSEGIKKLSILDSLLGSHYLSKDSVIFIDEPESALHPELVATFMQIIVELSKCGLQFFIATHSYFVIKKLYILAHQGKISIPMFSCYENGIDESNLRDGMPENPIINASVELYREEIDL